MKNKNTGINEIYKTEGKSFCEGPQKNAKGLSLCLVFFRAVLVFAAVFLIASFAAPSQKAEAKKRGYHYANLSSGEKELYDALTTAVDNYMASDAFSKTDVANTGISFCRATYTASLDQDQIKNALETVLLENPSYFFIGDGYTLSTAGKYVELKVGRCYLSAKERVRTMAYIDHVGSAWLEKINKIKNDGDDSDNDTEDAFEIALLLHDLIINRIDYSYESPKKPNTARYAHSIGGVFTADGAVCEGYAKAFGYMLDLAGIDNIVISGQGAGDAHAWNAVKIGGTYYLCDVTWDDLDCGPDSSTKPAGIYDHFMIPVSQFNQKHTAQINNLPQFADTTDYVYYYKYNSIVTVPLASLDQATAFVNAATAAADAAGRGAYIYYVADTTDSIQKILRACKQESATPFLNPYSGSYLYIKVREDLVSPDVDTWKWTDPQTGEEDPEKPVVTEPEEDTDPADYIVWLKGKKDLSKVILTSDISASTYTDKKGKEKEGKVVYLVTNSTPGAISFDATKHTLKTKSQKGIIAVSNKGVISPKGAGRAYVTVIDTGSFKYKTYSVLVKAAPTKLYVSSKAGSTQKADLVKKAVLQPDSLGIAYIVPFTGKDESSVDATFTAELVKDEDSEFLSVDAPARDAYGNVYVRIRTKKSAESAVKYKTVKITVTCNESGKKARFAVMIGNPVSEVAAVGSGTLSKKGDSVEIGLSFTTPVGNGIETTDKLKIIAAGTGATFNGKKVTTSGKAPFSVKLDKNTGKITLTYKDKVEGKSGKLYVLLTDPATKQGRLIEICTVSDGKVAISV